MLLRFSSLHKFTGGNDPSDQVCYVGLKLTQEMQQVHSYILHLHLVKLWYLVWIMESVRVNLDSVGLLCHICQYIITASLEHIINPGLKSLVGLHSADYTTTLQYNTGGLLPPWECKTLYWTFVYGYLVSKKEQIWEEVRSDGVSCSGIPAVQTSPISLKNSVQMPYIHDVHNSYKSCLRMVPLSIFIVHLLYTYILRSRE